MSNSDDEDKADRGNNSAPVAPYKVGYKKPPLHTRFKPGQSGNPSGLAKIPSNFDEMSLKELYRKVPATENGKPVKKSQLELLAEAVVKNGIRGTSSKASKLGIGLPSTARGARGGLGRGAGATLNGKAFNWQPVMATG